MSLAAAETDWVKRTGDADTPAEIISFNKKENTQEAPDAPLNGSFFFHGGRQTFVEQAPPEPSTDVVEANFALRPEMRVALAASIGTARIVERPTVHL